MSESHRHFLCSRTIIPIVLIVILSIALLLAVRQPHARPPTSIAAAASEITPRVSASPLPLCHAPLRLPCLSVFCRRVPPPGVREGGRASE
eukprot:1688805-Rhodomonas_salina.1